MAAFNSVSLISEGLKFTAKYPANQEKCPENPLKGYFNYIHLVDLFRETARNPNYTPTFVNTAINQFHDQQLLSMKMKLITPDTKTSRLENPSLQSRVVKYRQQLQKVDINHGNFNADQIAKGDGNSTETLSYSIRVRSDQLIHEKSRKSLRPMLNENSSTIGDVEKGIRDAVGKGQPLEVGIQNAEAVLLPALKRELGNDFDLKVKLKRQELFSDTQVVIGSSTYPGQDRGLSKRNDSTPRILGESLLAHYATMAPA